jgi:hypothetical protein
MLTTSRAAGTTKLQKGPVNGGAGRAVGISGLCRPGRGVACAS